MALKLTDSELWILVASKKYKIAYWALHNRFYEEHNIKSIHSTTFNEKDEIDIFTAAMKCGEWD